MVNVTAMEIGLHDIHGSYLLDLPFVDLYVIGLWRLAEDSG